MSASALSRPPLRHLLLGETSAPKSLVALFHGLGGSRHELQHVAESWSAALPHTAFLLFQAPDRDYHDRILLNGDWSGDWYKFPKPRSAFGADEDAYTQMVLSCVSDRCDHVSSELDGHLHSLGLSDRELILAGFSQGAAVSAYTGLRRRCLGVLPLGGPCPPRPSLLPDDNDVTRVCVVVGDADPYAPHEEIQSSFAKYGVHDETCGVHVLPGQGHVVSERSVEVGLDFLRRSLTPDDTLQPSMSSSQMRALFSAEPPPDADVLLERARSVWPEWTCPAYPASPSGRFREGLWWEAAGREQAAEERCLVTRGRATLWPLGGGAPYELRAGGWATFRRGFLCTWVVHEPIAKRYAYFDAEGRELS